jgi:hypothetical protein
VASEGTQNAEGTRLRSWWRTGTSPWVKIVLLLLVANGLPAFFLLTFASGHTDTLFVWTVVPQASAQMLGVMYADALVLVLIGLAQPSWARVRIIVFLVAYFSIAATTVTLFHLDPFLAHPWTHLAYWLTLYAALVIVAPIVLVAQERQHGGRLPIEVPLHALSKVIATVSVLVFGGLGSWMIVGGDAASDAWPWDLTPLVARLLGVWMTALAVTFAWALWDRDWVRTRPIFWQGIPIGVLAALVPVVHSGDVERTGLQLAAYCGLVALMTGGGLLSAATQRRSP